MRFYRSLWPTRSVRSIKLKGTLPKTRPAQHTLSRPKILFHLTVTSSLASRIIGGEPAKKNAYPEFVFLEVTLRDSDGRTLLSSCGGTLIAKNLVLTASHCVDFKNGVTITGGTALKGNIRHKKGIFSADHQARFKKWIKNPKFMDAKFDGHDIAVIVLESSLPGPFAKLATEREEPPVGASVTVVGFGMNNDYLVPLPPGTFPGQTGVEVQGSAPNKLYAVELTVGQANVEPCPKERAGPRPLWFTPEKEFCYYGEEFYVKEDANYGSNGGIGIKNDCNGDSGGPSFYNGLQVGLVSRGGEGMCGYSFRSPYTVHTKVSAHRRFFIKRMINKYAKS